MVFKSLKDSLPWLVPSAALVFAAYVMWDQKADPVATAPVQTTATQTSYQDAGSAQSLASGQDETVTRQEGGAQGLGVLTEPAMDVSASLPAADPVPTPTPEPQERTAALDTNTATDTSFFASAQTEDTRAQCIEDLRNLASQSRVYFPSGGLTADASGIQVGRVLGLVVQECPNVQILVEGHSDPSGDPQANLRLSEKRAQQVITRIAAAGIDTSMFVAIGKGDTVPSNVTGDKSRAYYDRRVEFSVFDAGQVARVSARAPASPTPWRDAECVQELQNAVDASMLFYANRSVSVRPEEFETAMALANMAVACPHARLRVIGHHSGDVQAGESIKTGLLRAKALMSMLVSRGVSPGQIIIAAPSRAGDTGQQAGMPGNRVEFDVILEDG
ncbi:MAG: OmpA family protein [Roseovarius sp.]